jgi:hypothetical protein
MALLVAGVLGYYVRSNVAVPLILDAMWRTHTQAGGGASVPVERDVSEEILGLRQKHHLRPLTETESGTPARDVARGIYGFSTCDVPTLSTSRRNGAFLEIHKHLDGIVYYVGYASEDDIEKYVTRQKNFHIVASVERKGKAPVLFEIPVDFVSKCTRRSGDDRLFDLFVTVIPELQSNRSLHARMVLGAADSPRRSLRTFPNNSIPSAFQAPDASRP